jgi:hypothetical protein
MLGALGSLDRLNREHFCKAWLSVDHGSAGYVRRGVDAVDQDIDEAEP